MTSLRTILWCPTSMTSIEQMVRMTTLKEAIITSKKSSHTCKTICISKSLKLMSQTNRQAKWVDTIWKVCWQELRTKDTLSRLITMESCHKVCHKVNWQPHRPLHHHTRINYQHNMSIIEQNYTGHSLLSIRHIYHSSQVTIRWLSLVMVSSILTLPELSRPKTCKISGHKNRLMKLILLAITLCSHRITTLSRLLLEIKTKSKRHFKPLRSIKWLKHRWVKELRSKYPLGNQATHNLVNNRCLLKLANPKRVSQSLQYRILIPPFPMMASLTTLQVLTLLRARSFMSTRQIVKSMKLWTTWNTISIYTQVPSRSDWLTILLSNKSMVSLH